MSLGRPTGDETRLDGLFVFKDGRFVQQSLNLGEPFTSQVAQAHAGTFTIENGKIDLFAEVGLIVNADGGVARRLEPQSSARAGGGATVQSARAHVRQRHGAEVHSASDPPQGAIVPLSKGALALVDGHFMLVFEEGGRALAGSGKYTQQGTTLQLTPERWLSANGSQVRYARARVDATLDARTLTIPGEGAIQVGGQRR